MTTRRKITKRTVINTSKHFGAMVNHSMAVRDILSRHYLADENTRKQWEKFIREMARAQDQILSEMLGMWSN